MDPFRVRSDFMDRLALLDWHTRTRLTHLGISESRLTLAQLRDMHEDAHARHKLFGHPCKDVDDAPAED